MALRSRESFPNIRIAGSKISAGDESAANCVQMKEGLNPGTPDHQKKYRKSYKNSHGHKILHYGVFDDTKPDEHHVCGVKVPASENVKYTLEDQNGQGVKQMVNEIKEAKYHSRKVEPLGRRMDRDYVFPGSVTQEDFKFGLPPVPSEFTAKETVFPPRPYTNDPASAAQYLRTHGNFEAGQQKRRGYDWKKIDPVKQVFGKTEMIQFTNEAALCLHPESIVDQFPKTTIVKKNQEDFRNFKNDQLGMPKNQGQDTASSTNIVFGARLGAPDEWNAGKCIKGEANLREVKSDKDLGRTTRFGFRNLTKQGDDYRVFGVPTIRKDITRQTEKSIADATNYGNEKPALHLLFPEKYAFLGVEQSDFANRRYKYEIKDIFEKIGFKYKIGKFEGIYQRALEIDNSLDTKCSANAFLRAIQEMDHIE